MKVKISFGISNCGKCPFHEEHKIVTAESFEQETGIYCSLVEDHDGSWWHYTHDGVITKRLIAVGDWHPEQHADVPGWCPFLIKQYAAIIANICDSVNWRKHTELKIDHIRNLTLYVINFISELAETNSEAFVYNYRFNCIERDIYLSIISISLYYAEESARKEFLKNSDIPEDDKKIIRDTIRCWSIKPMFLNKRTRSKAKKLRPILDTSIVVKMAIFLAEKYADTGDTDYVGHIQYLIKSKKLTSTQ